MDVRQTMPAVAVVVVLMAITSILADQADVVNTTLGPIQGLRKNVQGVDVDVYYGIPFAKPPVGDLRFKRPQPAESWSDVMSTVTKPNACHQKPGTMYYNTPMSEDCLYLNVWVPRGSEAPKATMVWIYGGSFHSGSSVIDVYDGSKLASTQNVIVASMNYRLGPLGFMYTGTNDAPGNQGLLDQTMAMQWIHQNVERFGGSQDSITIFGESAGSISVGLHLLSPLSGDFFTRAIMQSGAPSSSSELFVTRRKAKARSRQLSALFNCKGFQAARVQCLRQLPAQNVTDAQWVVDTEGFYKSIAFFPVVDGYFSQGTTEDLLEQGQGVKDAELLVGVNEDEGSFFLVNPFQQLLPQNATVTQDQFKAMFHEVSWRKTRESQALYSLYVDSVVPALRDTPRRILSDVSGDDLFVCPAVAFAKSFNGLGSRRNDTYLYRFNYRLSTTPWPKWMGVMHGYEIEAVFGLPRSANYTQQDLQVADVMMAYWARFAKTGNPNDPNNPTWPRLTAEEDEYLEITGDGQSVHQGLRRQYCAFHDNVLPLL